MASTKMARNRKAKQRKFNDLPWDDRQRAIDLENYTQFIKDLYEYEKSLKKNGKEKVHRNT